MESVGKHRSPDRQIAQVAKCSFLLGSSATRGLNYKTLRITEKERIKEKF